MDLLVLCALVSSAFNVIGLNMLLWSQLITKSTNPFRHNNTLFDYYWYLLGGILLEVASEGLYLLALNYGPQSLLASLDAVPILFNFVFLCIIHGGGGRIFTYLEWVLLLAICAGTTLSAISFVSSSPPPPAAALPNVTHAQLGTPAAIVFQALISCAAIILFGISYYLWAESSNHKLILWVVAGTSGLFYSLVTLNAKALLQLYDSIYVGEQVAYLLMFFITGCFQLGCLVIWLMQAAIPHETQIYVTVFTVNAMLWTFIGGGVVYQDFADFQAPQWAEFIVGGLISIAGLLFWALSS